MRHVTGKIWAWLSVAGLLSSGCNVVAGLEDFHVTDSNDGDASCDAEADCDACVTCAIAGSCSQAHADCSNIPECVCINDSYYDCGGEQTCIDEQCGHYDPAYDAFNALWECAGFECASSCPSTGGA